MSYRLLCGDALDVLETMEPQSVHCVVTSPPYWGLRDYGTDGQLGLEATPEEYVRAMVSVFDRVWRVLRDDGTLWLNLGDSYAGSGAVAGGAWSQSNTGSGGRWRGGCEATQRRHHPPSALKEKDLVGIPWRVAFALQAAGWYLRSDIIWCLSGGTLLYTRTQKGDMPMTIKDMARLDPSTVQLWNGRKWTQLLGVSKSQRKGEELELVLRSGERVSCTPTHRFPTHRGLLPASDIRVGDVIKSTKLPEPDFPRDCAIDSDAAWFAGLYVAEGSRAGDTIQIAGHAKEEGRWERVKAIAAKYGGSVTRTVNGNGMAIRVYGKLLNAILDELVTGRTAHTKAFAPVVWRYSNRFIAAMVDGYLAGDGCRDGNRWRLGFCRNYNLERDLRTACARLGYTLTLNMAHTPYNGRRVPTFHGELRTENSGHWNEKDRAEVVAIRKSRCRGVYDIGVADEPHLFALASGVLTHNSKPNPMPESVTDRPTKSHEYVFLLTKKPRYFYDSEAVKEPVTSSTLTRVALAERRNVEANNQSTGDEPSSYKRCDTARVSVDRYADERDHLVCKPNGSTRNRRSVWHIATEPYPEAHFATFPQALVKPCILAGTSERGVCPACGKPWARVVEKPQPPEAMRNRGNGAKMDFHGRQVGGGQKLQDWYDDHPVATTGWRAGCGCDAGEPVPATVLDPFCGSGTTGLVALTYGRNFIGIDLSADYLALAEKRIAPAAAQGVLL